MGWAFKGYRLLGKKLKPLNSNVIYLLMETVVVRPHKFANRQPIHLDQASIQHIEEE